MHRRIVDAAGRRGAAAASPRRRFRPGQQLHEPPAGRWTTVGPVFSSFFFVVVVQSLLKVFVAAHQWNRDRCRTYLELFVD